jgi:hypothetical protein
MIISAVLFALLLGGFLLAVLSNCSRSVRALAASLFVVLIAVVYAGSVEMLSLPKPQHLEWRDPAKARVLAANISEGKAIYVWLQLGDSPEPRSYVLPWNMQMAQQLQKAMRESQQGGAKVEVTRPFRSRPRAADDPGKPVFYAEPQPPPPPKSIGNNAALFPPPDGG